ncbi:MAG: hypothetical protein PHT88_04260 [Candidatus Moranbacteria bacterium]|nr:hypothetical protein [Candidatus Moranbacteria bacterium]
MTWITVAIAGYFFNALANILDKYILSTKIPQPSVYAFFVAVFSLFALVDVPFGLRILSPQMIVAAFLAGAFFIYGLIFFYRAVRESEISRVAPLMGAFMALGALTYDFASHINRLDWLHHPFLGRSENILAFWLLLIGGFLVAFDLPFHIRDIFRGIRNTSAASAFMVVSLVMLKQIYFAEGFVNGFVWSRMGLFLGGLSLLLVPTFRKEIIGSLSDMSRSKREQRLTGSWFVANKVIGALGNFLVQYAIFLGPLVAVQAFSGVQFAFVFLVAVPLSIRFPTLFGEKLYFNDWLQKVVALTLIGLGIYFSALSGADLFV